MVNRFQNIISVLTFVFSRPSHWIRCSSSCSRHRVFCTGLALVIIACMGMITGSVVDVTRRGRSKLDLTSVSGFYGPGAYLTWLLSALSCLVTTTILTTHDPSSGQQENLEDRSHLAELFLAVSYPLCTFIDNLIRVAHRSCDAQLAAASTVMFTSTTLCLGACMIAAPPHKLPLPHLIPLRATAWFITQSASLIAVAFLRCSTFNTASQTHFLILMALTWLATMISLFRTMEERWARLCALTLFMAVHFVSLAFLGDGPKSIFPRTSCRIVDLDQAFALGTIVVLLTLQWGRWAGFPKVSEIFRMYIASNFFKAWNPSVTPSATPAITTMPHLSP
jgi:hypothetical protein